MIVKSLVGRIGEFRTDGYGYGSGKFKVVEDKGKKTVKIKHENPLDSDFYSREFIKKNLFVI